MGSSKPQLLLGSAFALATSYGSAFTDSFEVQGNDFTTIVIDIDAGASVTGLTIKLQHVDDNGAVDFYRSGDSGFVVEEFALPAIAATTGQRFAIPLYTRGMGSVRIGAKTVGGTGTLNSIHAIRDGSETPTPRS